MITIVFLYFAVCLCICEVRAAYSKFTEYTDMDGSTFQLRPLPKRPGQVGSCYEIKKDLDEFKFCYPAVHVAGVGKCGTSAMYKFFVDHDYMHEAKVNSKEYCPHKTIVKYLKAFEGNLPESGKIYVNGCIKAAAVIKMHQILKPTAAYIMTVRHYADRMWAAYNFWCSSLYDTECSGLRWAKEGMFRTPELFHEMLMSRSSPQSHMFVTSCGEMSRFYSAMIANFADNNLEPPHVVAIEALSLPGAEEHILRLQNYINSKLHTNIALDPGHMHRVNTGDHPGTRSIVNTTSAHEDGVYKISGRRHMLPDSAQYLTGCWKECRNISTLTQHRYNCSEDF